jgi:cytochrome c oxidase subunit 1
MPRRIPDYPDAFAGWNYICSFGSVVSLFSAILFLYILFDQLTSHVQVGPNPWFVPQFFDSNNPASLTRTAPTLEWLVSSPPAFHHINELPIST